MRESGRDPLNQTDSRRIDYARPRFYRPAALLSVSTPVLTQDVAQDVAQQREHNALR